LGRDPDFLLASSVNGEVFSSTDAGDSWSKFAREFGEVHALIWAPELALGHSAGIGKSRPTG
jgi:hypothetical protein